MKAKKIRHHQKFYGFTLVELIVVITILVILGTIAFLNLGGFTGSARDGARVSDVTNIAQGLELVLLKNGSVPTPGAADKGVISITASGIVIGRQGYADANVLSFIKMSDAKDPLDKRYYTYTTNSISSKYQILGFLEDATTVTSFNSLSPVDTVYAGYETRIPFARGSYLGTLLSNTGLTLNQPIQEMYSPTTLTGVEIYTATGGNYKAYVSSKIALSGTGPVLWELSGRLDATVGTFPGCDTPNIKLPNGQIWATCNVGASVASVQSTLINGDWSSLTTTEVSTIGQYFQWGRNDVLQIDYSSGANYSTGIQYAPANNLGHSLFISNSSNGSWMTTADYSLWGGSGSDSTTGDYTSLGYPSSMQGPCSKGYHIGTQKEWNDAGLTIVGAKNTLSAGSGSLFSTVLKLPYGGRRYYGSPASFDGVWSVYWQSSASSVNGFRDAGYRVSDGALLLSDSSNGASGAMIRCLKN